MQAVDPPLISSEQSFVRNKFTWLSYILTAYFGFGVSLIGPLMPFIIDKLGLTFTEVGYHFMLMSIGSLITGVIGDPVAKRIGNERMGLGGILSMVTGLLGLAYGPNLISSLLAILMYGIGTGFLIIVATVATANANPQHRAEAFSEANIGGGIALIIGPALVGGMAASALGWQTIAFVPPIVALAIIIVFGGLPMPKTLPADEHWAEAHNASAPLSFLFWVFGILMLMSIAGELLVSSWGANFLRDAIGYEASTAAALMSVFAMAIVLGRLVGRHLLEMMPQSRLLLFSLFWVLLAFPVFWLGPTPEINIFGLFLTKKNKRGSP